MKNNIDIGVQVEILQGFVNRWKNYVEDKDTDWIYDQGYEFLSDLSRGDAVSLMETVTKLNELLEEELSVIHNSAEEEKK